MAANFCAVDRKRTLRASDKVQQGETPVPFITEHDPQDFLHKSSMLSDKAFRLYGAGIRPPGKLRFQLPRLEQDRCRYVRISAHEE